MRSDEAPPSRTQRKREALDLQKTGARLVALTPTELARIPLPDELADAVRTCQGISAHGGRRRQLQFIGKLMRSVEVDPILDALAALEGQSAQERYALHQLEHWRQRLLDEPDALTEYLDSHPGADRQRLRQQLTRARNAGSEAEIRKESRALFRLLREFQDGES
jgi:ribosome-associated protein